MTHSLFAFSSKSGCFLQRCCLIFLDRLVQGIAAVQEKLTDLSAPHPAWAEQVTLISSHTSLVQPLPPKPPFILFGLGWLFC